jgi:hypothetical protein
MDLVLVEIGSPEWNFIWLYVDSHPINEGIEQASLILTDGVGWEYMGTLMQGDKAIHQVRHKNLPKTDGVYNLTFNASEGFTHEQIAKKFRL